MYMEKNLKQHLLDRRYTFEDELSLIEWTKDERRCIAEAISGICVLINSDRNLLDRPECVDALKKYVAAEIALASKKNQSASSSNSEEARDVVLCGESFNERDNEIVTDEEILAQNEQIEHVAVQNQFENVTDEEILAQNEQIERVAVHNLFENVTDEEILAQNEQIERVAVHNLFENVTDEEILAQNEQIEM